MDSLDGQKRALRAQVRQRLPAPGSAAHGAASAAAQDRLSGWSRLRDARVIGLYRALPSECDTSRLADALVQQGKSLCYPVVGEGLVLRFHRHEGEFCRGALGVEEPQGPEVPLIAIELLVVPAVAVDDRGHRVGRGKGYYDATLARSDCPSVALVFDVQIVPSVPAAPHDQRVSAVCSELRLVEVKA